MMWHVKPKKLSGKITVPSSKSHSIRALLFALLAKGKSEIKNLLPSPDMIETCRRLGAQVEIFPDRVEVEGINGQVSGVRDVIQAGNSGLILRFVGALAGLSSEPIVITGDRSIRERRPMTPLFEGLKQLGAEIISSQTPYIIQGPIHSGVAVIEGRDSQFVSGLLIAASLAKGPIEIHVNHPGEKPWVDLTLDWFDRLGISYQREGYEFYRLEGETEIQRFSYTVPGDFSSAAFPLVAAILTQSELTLENLDINDSQGDKKIIEVLQRMGAEIIIKDSQLRVKPSSYLRGITIDMDALIDAIPILSVLGCFAEGETRLINGGNARYKECDRLSAMATELRKMGAEIEEFDEGLTIRRSFLKGACVDSHEDHRVAMALAVAGLAAEGETKIERTECVRKTYPNFSTVIIE